MIGFIQGTLLSVTVLNLEVWSNNYKSVIHDDNKCMNFITIEQDGL